MSEDADREVLARRAEALALSRKSAEALADQDTFTLFRRGDASYAIEKRFVFELASVLRPTPLPLAPPHWRGIANLHGDLVAVADLPPLLDEQVQASAAPPDARILALVLGRERREFAIVIDAALHIQTIRSEFARSAGELLPAAHFVRGALADGTRVLDGQALLEDPRLFIAEHSSNNHA